MSEQQLLGLHTSRREDPDRQLPLLPAPKRIRHIRKDFANQLTAPVAIVPDPALQILEGWRLAIAIHEPLGVDRDRREPGGFRFVGPGRYGLAEPRIGGVLVAEGGEERLVLWRTRVPFEMGTQVCSRMREQHLRDKGNRRGRAFDIQEDRADPGRGRTAVHTRIG
jgi:hypothetical protein